MSNLENTIDELEDNRLKLYSNNEINEFLFSLYTCITIALRLQSAALFVVAPAQVIYLKKDGQVILKSPDEVIEINRISNIEVLDFIFSKDKLVASLLQVISRDDKEVRCTINHP
jgi:hypothetical protein